MGKVKIEILSKDKLENVMQSVTIMHILVSQMPDDFVLPTICTVLDTWFAEHGFTEEEAIVTYRKMAEIAERCYEEIGLDPRREKGGER